MRVLSIDPTPITSFDYANAGHDRRAHRTRLPVLLGRVDRLPRDIDALVLTGDLQGREWPVPQSGAGQLIGKLVPRALEALLADRELPEARRCGVLLAGDLYSVPLANRRGGEGDVVEVWEAFAESFAWVVGVLGNHDRLGPGTAPPGWMRRHPRVRCLLQEVFAVGDVTIGGVSGIIGNPRRTNADTEDDYVSRLIEVLSGKPEILLMHDGPDVPGTDLRGWASIREAIELAPPDAPSLVVRAHSWWPTPLAELAGGRQVLNVDGRIVVLTR